MSIDGQLLTDVDAALQHAAATGESMCVVVAAPRGGGKSHLLRHLHGSERLTHACPVLLRTHLDVIRCPWAGDSAHKLVMFDNIDTIATSLQLLGVAGALRHAWSSIRRKAAVAVVAVCGSAAGSLPQMLLDVWPAPIVVEVPQRIPQHRIVLHQSLDSGASSTAGTWQAWAALFAGLRKHMSPSGEICCAVSTASIEGEIGELLTKAPDPGVARGLGLDNVVHSVQFALRPLQRLQGTLGSGGALGAVARSIPMTTGVLIAGPHGAGKTLLLKSLPALTCVPVLYVRATELFAMYLGETEARLRKLFQRAREMAPCVLAIDNIEHIATSRGATSTGTNGQQANVGSRVLAALLCEMDGMMGRDGILIVGTALRTSALDNALLRQGRFETVIELAAG